MNIFNNFKKLVFQLDAEKAHELTLNLLNLCPHLTRLYHSKINAQLQTNLHHLNFSTPFGIAAGLDKNADALLAWNHLPLGHLEIGTVTLKPQEGNPKPRVFRFPKNEEIINAMGFPSIGAEKILKNLKENLNYSLGVNIGKNKNSTEEMALEEYSFLAKMFAPYCQYLTINLSSPNTPHLRDLQNDTFLSELKKRLLDIKIPILVKISPDLSEEQCLNLTHSLMKNQFSGIIATNTTKDHHMDKGGLSGKGLFLKSENIRRLVLNQIHNTNLDFIGVGGFSKFSQVLDYWSMGGRALQIYTHLVFYGPAVFQEWNKKTLELIKYSGNKNLEQCFQNPDIFKSYKKQLKD
jgi:dihydroorotate dehydrogenase